MDTKQHKRVGSGSPAGVGRLVRRLERERRSWARRPTGETRWPTEVAWRAGIAEGLRLAQAGDPQGGVTGDQADQGGDQPPVEAEVRRVLVRPANRG